MNVIVVNNPYSTIDWQHSPRIKSVSHEHVFDAGRVARMYDRGIRLFAHVHYQPAVPRVPLSNINGTFEDWCYYDASNFYKSGDKSNKATYTAVNARKKVPIKTRNTTTNFRTTGLTVAYLDINRDNRWTQLIGNPDDYATWDECCEDESAWVERTWEDVDEHLVKNTKTTAYSIPTFKSAESVNEYSGMSSISFAGDGLTHSTDEIPQIPNAEHTQFIGLGHFNVLGSVNSEASWSLGAPNDWRDEHRWYNINDIGTLFPTDSSFHDSRLFGTLNHSASTSQFKNLQELYPWFKGYEIFNNGMSAIDNSLYRDTFHSFLNEGRTVYCVAVTDWQQDFRQISDVDGGTNVLYMPDNYESLSVLDKSKAGLDCYCDGKFVASRFGSRHVVDFSVNENDGTAHFEVSGIAKDISLVFNGNYTTLHDVSEIEVVIPRGTSNITAEAWFADGNNQIYKSDAKLADDSDFIFTQAIIVKIPKKESIMNEKMMMFALED